MDGRARVAVNRSGGRGRINIDAGVEAAKAYGKALEIRFKILNVTRFHPGCTDKITRLREFMEEHSLRPEQVLYMGDDLPDIECLQYVGMPVCPADAVPEVQNVCRYVSQFNGGGGCVRDMIEQVLRARGDWDHSKAGMGVRSAPSV